ncbi:MAG: hypothetical protein ACJ0QM_04575 [Schleiferiaceae bacterium]|tara:strand:+ start:13314 stop:13814 length:501 start_codon:yes stop_codon:yes gene_type:complete
MEYINSKGKRKFEILKDKIVILSGTQPKWYSSNIEFVFGDETYKIAKSNFWGTRFECLKNKIKIGEMSLMWKKENTILFNDGNNDDVYKYQLTELNSKNWLSSDKTYTLSKGSTPILFIDFSYKKFKEHIALRFTDKENYPLLMCAMFIIRSKQNSQAAGSAFIGG